MVTCYLRYVLDPAKLKEFERNAEFETPRGHANVETNFHGFNGGVTISRVSFLP